MLPLEIVNLISNFVGYNNCHVCQKKISCTDNYIKQSNFYFCSQDCYFFS